MNQLINKRSLFLLLLTLSFALSSCQFKYKSDNFAQNDNPKCFAIQQDFDDFLMEEFQNSFEDNMLILHYTLKNPKLYGIEKPDSAFSPLTKEYNEKCKNDLIETKKELTSFDKAKLTDQQQLTYDTLSRYLEQQITLSSYPQFLHVLGADTGISSTLPLTLSQYTFYKEEDITEYLAILTAVPSLLEEALLWEQMQANTGYSLSNFEIKDTIKQIDTFLYASHPNPDNLLITSFNARLDTIENLSSDQKSTYKNNNNDLVTTLIIPAFQRLKEGLIELGKKAPEGTGLYYYEDGREYYELLIQSMTFSQRSVNTLIKTLEKRLNKLTKQISNINTSSPEAYDIFYQTEQYTNDTPQEMLQKLKEYMKNDYPAIDNICYFVEPIPNALKNNTTAAYYMIPPLDSPTENRIYYGDNNSNSASLFMTLSHEGYPGHLYHQNYMLQHNLHPIYYVLDITGYKEAWAYYVEIDMADYCNFGNYETLYHDELTELHRCDLEFSYAISSLIDLYVNGKGYDENQVGILLERYGLNATSAKAFFEYAVEEPGAYLQYYVGYLELLEIRHRVEKTLGNAFDEKEFHTQILDFGPCYFDTLADLMDVLK